MLVALSIVILGLYDCLKFKKTTLLLEEIIDFICLFKNEMNYRRASYPDLIKLGEKQGYTYISFENNKPSVDNLACALTREFNQFAEQIGTTDDEGQITLCNEYKEKFSHLLKVQRSKEESKFQVNLSLSLLGAMSVIIIFI